jgi:hypothetical protein
MRLKTLNPLNPLVVQKKNVEQNDAVIVARLHVARLLVVALARNDAMNHEP